MGTRTTGSDERWDSCGSKCSKWCSILRNSEERIRIDNQQHQGIRRIDVKLQSEGRDIDIKIELMDDGSIEPHQVVTPTAEEDFTFTHKITGLPVLGDIRLGEHRYSLDPKKDQAVIDFTFGYPARRTEWDWLSMTGITSCGKNVGVNLVNPILTQNIMKMYFGSMESES